MPFRVANCAYLRVANKHNKQSIVNRISTDFGLVYDRVGIFGTVIGIQVAEVAGLAVEVQHVGQVNGVSDDPRGIHEVIGNFLTDQQNSLHKHRSTMRGPK